MATVNPNPFAQKVLSKTITTLPSSTLNLFQITGGPIQIMYCTGLVEADIAGTSYSVYVRNQNGSSQSDFSSAITATGLSKATMIDFLAPFDTPPSGNPRADNYGINAYFVSTGSIQLVPGGTAGTGTLTVSIVYWPMTLETRVTVV